MRTHSIFHAHSGRLFSVVALISLALGPTTARPQAQVKAPGLTPTITYPIKYDLSSPLRDIAPLPPKVGETQLIPRGPLPNRDRKRPAQPGPAAADPLLQFRPSDVSMPSPTQNFEGVSNVDGVLPPDTQGDVGPNHYVQWVNLSFAIWNKSGSLLYGPATGNTLWTGFGGPCENTNDGDPITQYDPLADRWLMSQFALPTFPNGPFYQCIAVSQTGDPTGAWYRYVYEWPGNKMNDYPKFGVWPDGYYMTVNQFASGTFDWAGAGVAVFERSQMLSGLVARMVSFDLFSVNEDFGGILPSDLDGDPPPAGAPNYFAEVDDGNFIGPSDAMRIWEFHVDWTTPANSTFGLSGQPNATIPVTDFTPICLSTFSCIPQPGTSQGLDAIGDRLMYRLQYRSFDTHESLVVNHTVDAGSGRAGVRWYELRDPGGTPSIYQAGTYAGDTPDTEHRWMGSIAMDHVGNIALGYSVSSETVYPSIRYVGRLESDPLNTLGQGESTLIAGTGSQTHSAARWGDYSMMGLDPTDDCTFWYTQEYIQTTSSAGWQTRIGSFKFPSCTSGPRGTLLGTVTDFSTGLPISGATIQAGANTTFTNGSGFYTVNLPVGIYNVTASVYGYDPEGAVGVSVTDGGTTTQDFELNPLPAVNISGAVTDGSGHGWPLYAQINISTAGYSDTIFTDFLTGTYTVELVEGVPYTFDVQAVSSGYNEDTREVTPPPGGSLEDFALTIDATCTAPGYTTNAVLSESFDSGSLPAGWQNVDNIGNGQVWQFNDPGGRGNLTGGSGLFAILDSDNYGPVGIQDAELISPLINLSGEPDVTLQFDTDFFYWDLEIADVDVSDDGGSSWFNVWSKSGVDYPGPAHEAVDISAIVGGQPDAKVRFHYYDAEWAFWWQVDNVMVGPASCATLDGGLLVGNVRDGNTGGALNGATVASVSAPEDTVSTSSTPDDPAVDDGFYTLFSSLTGTQSFSASKTRYADDTRSVAVVADGVVGQDFDLSAGRLTVDPTTLEVEIPLGGMTTLDLTLSNDGGLAADWELAEIPGATTALGPFEQPSSVVKPFKQGFATASGLSLPELPAAPPYAAGDVFQSWTPAQPASWGIAYDVNDDTVWVGSPVSSWGGDGTFYEYDTTGGPTGRSHSFSWIPPYGPADAAYNLYTGTLWVMNIDTASGNNCIYEIDPSAGYTGERICPDDTGFTTSQRGLAYDPYTDSWFAGSWNDFMIHHFASDGTMLDEVDVGLAVAGLAYNPDTQHLFVMVNDSPNPVYVLDAADEYEMVGQFNVSEGFGDYAGAGLEIDCDGHLWAVDQEGIPVIYEFDSGETTSLCVQDVAWLSEDVVDGSLDPGSSQPIVVTFDAGVPEAAFPGEYHAQLKVVHQTPYSVGNIQVTMRVVAPYQIRLPLIRR